MVTYCGRKFRDLWQGAFNWLADNYGRFAEWSSSASPVASLLLSLDELQDAKAHYRAFSSQAALPRERFVIDLEQHRSVS